MALEAVCFRVVGLYVRAYMCAWTTAFPTGWQSTPSESLQQVLGVFVFTVIWHLAGGSDRVAVMFIVTAAAIYSLGHGLCTSTAVPRSTQPSTLRGMVK